MYSSRIIQNIAFPIAKENIFPCGKRFCLCIEYLNFSKKKDVQYYKNCMINDLKEDYKEHRMYRFETNYQDKLYFHAKN